MSGDVGRCRGDVGRYRGDVGEGLEDELRVARLAALYLPEISRCISPVSRRCAWRGWPPRSRAIRAGDTFP